MKKCIRLLAMLLACGMLLLNPAYATTEVEPRESSFFMSHTVALYKTSSTSFQIWFDADSVDTMDEIGASIIHVYRSADGDSWTKVRSYYKENYPNMTCENTMSHVDYVTYTGAWSGYYYRAAITLYARNSTGVGERLRYTEIIKM